MEKKKIKSLIINYQFLIFKLILLSFPITIRCHSRESGNPVKTDRIWIPNQVGNDTKATHCLEINLLEI